MPTTYTPFANELELETTDTQHENNVAYNNEQYAGYSPFSSTYEAEATPRFVAHKTYNSTLFTTRTIEEHF